MDVRLIGLLGSVASASSQYALARLELAMHFPKYPAPPVIDRLVEPSERGLRQQWPAFEAQLEEAMAYAKRLERSRRRGLPPNEGFRLLRRSLRELDQYARAVAWVLTVTESSRYDA